MAEHRFQFDWDVPAAGYLWVTATSIGGDTKLAGPALVGRDLLEPAAAAGPPRKPEPHPLLFRLLAETSPDEGGILTFASRYGNLFSPGNDLALSGRRARHSPAGVRGVFLAAWQYHIAEMRRLTELWDRVHGEDEEALAPHIRWVLEPPEGPSVYFDRHPARTAETGRSEDAAGRAN